VLPPTDAYQLVDYYMAYSPNEDLTFSFGVDNLFDQYYAKYLDVTTLGTPTGSATLNSFSPGRTFKVGLKVRFGDWFFRS
jgi:outer membrane receptor protein involved in Fe transport